MLACSMHEGPGYAKRALTVGVRGRITKCEAQRELACAVRDVREGRMLIGSRAAEGLG